MAPHRKRKAGAAAVAEVDGAADASAADSELNEIEQQLCAHAASAYNDFVQFFQRRTSELIAANRMMIVRHQEVAAQARRSYPVAATLQHHNALMNVNVVETSEPLLPPLPNVKKTVQTVLYNPTETATLYQRSVRLPRVLATPNSTMWTALSKNYDVEDQPQLKYLPYFGDDDEDDVVSEFYQIKLQGTSALEVDFAKEMCESVLQQLHSTWELSASDLDRVARTIHVEPEVVAEIHKKMRIAQRRAKKKRRVDAAAASDLERTTAAAAADPTDPNAAATPATTAPPAAETPESLENYFELYEKAVDSYRTLFCRRCYKYDCDYHGCVEAPKLEVTEQNAVAEKIRRKTSAANTGRNCGNECFLGRMGSAPQHFVKARAIATAFGWDAPKRLACARAYFICSGNFCDIAKMLGDKTCLDVAEFCDFYEINEMSLAEERKLQWKPRRSGKKKKMAPSISHLQHTLSRLVDGVPTKIEPCVHAGPCDQSCSCITDGVFCSKLCNCVHSSCQIFYRGCKCAKGRCRTKTCPCFAAGRECDLDQCVVCCADEIAARTAHASAAAGLPSTAPLATTTTVQCHNRNMTLGRTKHLRVARSTMGDAGWGLFVDEFVAKDEFLIEYIGEMVTHEEAERRGAVYDKLNRSYLFNLDSGSVVDSTRKGNKTRFINHDSVKPNCFAKIVNVNSDYRIGMYALRDLEPHTELFFDYRYDQEFHNVNLHKQSTVTEWMKEPKSAKEPKQSLRKPLPF